MKDYPLNFKVDGVTAQKFQEIMHKLESDNQTEVQELIICVVHKILTTDGIGKFLSFLRR